MLEKLFPKEKIFFDHFKRHAEKTLEGAKLLHELILDLNGVEEKSRKLKDIEHEGDTITHQTVEKLHKTFITPLDRDEIHMLISQMDNILDHIEATSERLSLYELKESKEEAVQLSSVLVQAVEEVRKVVMGLTNLKDSKSIIDTCIHINQLENEGDVILRKGVAKLFRETKDPLEVMKWKEIYEELEAATDRCEDVANIVEGIVLENA